MKLYEEADKPSNALDYLKNNFTGKDPEDSKLKVENLEKENEQLKEKVSQGWFQNNQCYKHFPYNSVILKLILLLFMIRGGGSSAHPPFNA